MLNYTFLIKESIKVLQNKNNTTKIKNIIVSTIINKFYYNININIVDLPNNLFF